MTDKAIFLNVVSVPGMVIPVASMMFPEIFATPVTLILPSTYKLPTSKDRGISGDEEFELIGGFPASGPIFTILSIVAVWLTRMLGKII